MPRTAFASDFDGTLHFHYTDGRPAISPEDVAAVEAYQASGGLFGICTGRPLRGLTMQSADYVHLDFCIAATGAAIYDANERLLWGSMLDEGVVRELWETYRDEVDDCVFSCDKDYFLIGGPSRWPGIGIVPSFDDLPRPFTSFSVETATVEQSTRIAAELKERFAGRCEGHQNLNSVDIVAPGCSKGSGIAFVRERFGLDAVAGIGDSFNDLPMLEVADVAYTFPHVDAAVRERADALVGSVAEALADFMARG